jgi:hypothetical protein
MRLARLPAALLLPAVLAAGCVGTRTVRPAPAAALAEPIQTERSACLDSAAGSVSLKPLGQAAGLGLTMGLVTGVVEGVKAHRAYVGAYERCLSEQTASLAEPYPSPDIDEVKRAP